MSTRIRALAALLLTATVAVSGCTGSGDDQKRGSGAPDRVAYMTSFGAVGRDAYAWVAESKGYFREANLQVTINLGAGNAENLKALAAGAAQFVAVDLNGAWIVAGKGDMKDFTAIMAVHQQSLISIITLEGNGITQPRDLEGKKVAMPTGTVNQMLFPAYARLAGFDDKKVQIQNVATTQLNAALASGQVQALNMYLVGQKGIEKAAGRKTVIMPYNTYLSDLYGVGIVTGNKLAKDKPDLARRFRTAMIKALKYSIEHPQEAAEILKKAHPTSDVAVAAAEIPLMAPYVGSGNQIGVLDRSRVARSIATLQGAGLIQPGLTPEAVVDFGIAPKA